MIKHTKKILLALIAVIGLSACGAKEAAPGKPEALSNEPNKAAATSVETPSQVTKNFLEAVRSRRYGEIRDMLSERSVVNLNQAAGRSGGNIDQTLKRIVDQDAAGMAANNVAAFETRNEEIRGDRASVEAKAINAPQYARINLSKEGNLWKVNIDETTPAQ